MAGKIPTSLAGANVKKPLLPWGGKAGVARENDPWADMNLTPGARRLLARLSPSARRAARAKIAKESQGTETPVWRRKAGGV